MAVVVPASARRAPAEVRSEDTRPLPVLPALAPLFATGGLRRGSAVAVRGSASLLLALLAGPARGGAWCGVVGLPSLGLVAAREAGIPLERLALVPEPGRDWASVVAALLDAMEVVVVAPRGRVTDGEVRRLAARARQRGAVLVPFGPVPWPGTELRLSMTAGVWEGVGDGCGHLRSRRVVVRGEGRGSAARARELPLWLPSPDGDVRPAEPPVRLLPATDPPPAPRLRPVPDLATVDAPPAAHQAEPPPRPDRTGRGTRLRPLPSAASSRPRPTGSPVPVGRCGAGGGGSTPAPPAAARAGVPPTPPSSGPPPVPPRPGVPAELLARLRPASTLPRPPRPVARG